MILKKTVSTYLFYVFSLVGVIANAATKEMKISTSLSVTYSTMILLFLDFITLFLATLVLQDFCNKVDNFKDHSSSSPIDCLEELKAGMETLKSSLSPYLFMIFSCQCLSLINSALNILYDLDNLYDFLLPLLETTWQLFYIAYVLDETVESYRSLRNKIR